MNVRSSFFVYQSFSRLFSRFARLTQQVRPLITGNPSRSPRQYGDLSMTGTRIISTNVPLLSAEEHPKKLEKVLRVHERTVFVTNFRNPVTEETLREYFSQFGEIENFEWVRTKVTRRTKGYAFVTYKNKEDYANVLRQSHTLNGGQMIVKTSRPILPESDTTCFVIVNNVDAKMRKEDLLEHFSKYGTVVAIDWPIDKVARSRLDHCFLQFSSEEEVEEAANDERQILGDQEVLVRKSTSRISKHLTTTNRLLVLADSTVESIAAYFGKFGEVEAVWGNFKSVGPNSSVIPMFSVVFKKASSVQEISKQSHFINDQEVFTLRGVNKPIFQFEKKIVVDELPDLVSAENVIQHFQQFGPIQHCHFAEDPRNGQNLNCTINFCHHESVRKAMINENHNLRGKQVRVRRVGYRHVDKTSMEIINHL